MTEPAALTHATHRPTPRPGPAAVLFDMDGLLIDSEPIWSIAETELARRAGGEWSPELKAHIVGTSLPVAVPRILAWFGNTDIDPVRAQQTLLDRMVELFSDELPVRPGALELLDELRAAGVPTALVSASYRVLVRAALPTLGAHRFTVVVDGDDVTHHKPHPEPYLVATTRLGVDPARCVVFEDSPTGIESAEAAGCIAVGVPDQTSLPETPNRPVVASLAEVDLRWLTDLVERLRPLG